jgi:flagellar L-ring protein precursor FlgH
MRYTTLPIVLCVLSLPAAARADSLWRQAGRDAGSVFRDTKARRVGDIVTIVIQESASVTKEKETELKKNSETEAKIELLRLFKNIGVKDTTDLPSLKWDSKREFKGEADQKTKEEFTKTMTAVVKEVLPNGNLLIEGSSDVVTDDDITTVTVSGAIRPQDITPTNTISSRQIANARINYQTKGPLKQNTRKGWADRFLDIIWPF